MLISEVLKQAFLYSLGNLLYIYIYIYRCATGEKWNILMGELANTDGYKGKSCVSDQDYDERQRDGILGCGSFVAYPFFLTYMILMAMLVFNLFVAVVLAGFAEAVHKYIYIYIYR